MPERVDGPTQVVNVNRRGILMEQQGKRDSGAAGVGLDVVDVLESALIEKPHDHRGQSAFTAGVPQWRVERHRQLQ